MSPFLHIERRLAEPATAVFAPLHQGRTTFAPHADVSDWDSAGFELRAHEHAPPAGVRSLRGMLAATVEQRLGHAVSPERVIVTCGATQAMDLALRCILDAGDEVLILSPQWLFAAGLVHAARGRPVEVPVFLELNRDPDFDLIAAVESRIGGRTRALAFNTPNNPTGQSLSARHLGALAELAGRHGLWILADHAYEHYDFSADGFIDIAAFEAAADRTVSLHSFSKTSAMPGHRIGFAVVPEAMAGRMESWSLHSTYSVATPSQFAARRALDVAPRRIAAQREHVRRARDLTMATLDVPHSRVDGGLYTLLDLAGYPDGASAFLDRCLDAGVSLAPGSAFGARCADHARMCFTAVDHDALVEAIDRVNRVYGGNRVEA